MPEIAVVADDLTGAADTGAQLVRAGYRTAVVFRGAEIPSAGLDAVVLDTDSRTMPAVLAEKRVVEAGHAVRGARIVYKKMDSTLRGNVAVELSAALGTTGRERVVLAPAFPAAGRTTVGGVQLVRGIPVHETEMRDDPRTPVTEAHLPTLLAGAFGRIGVLSTKDLADPELIHRTLQENVCVVADAESDPDLAALVRAVPDPERVLWAGSAGLALALGAAYPAPGEGEAPAPPERARRVLVVIGSLSGISREQLRRLEEVYGGIAVSVSAETVSGSERMAGAVLLESGCAVLHSPSKRGAAGSAGSVTNALAEVAGRLAEEEAFDALVLTGGSTAVAVSRRVGASGILLGGEVRSGVPVGALIGARPYPVVTKAGGFGDSDTLVEAVRYLKRED